MLFRPDARAPTPSPDGARRRPLDNPRVLTLAVCCSSAFSPGCSGWPTARATSRRRCSPTSCSTSLLAVDLALLVALVLRARAQPAQALGRAAAGGAVRAVPRQARRGAAGDDDRPGRARAASAAARSSATAPRAGSASRSTTC